MTAHLVLGKDRSAITSAEVDDFLTPFSLCVLDIGAGDGKGSLRYARSHPDTAVIALDSSFDALVETAKSARKKAARGGATNLMCIYGNIKDAYDVVSHVADEVRIYLPWGDLLEGIATITPEIISPIAQCAKPNGTVTFVINAEIWKDNLPKYLEHLGEITPEFFLERQDQFSELGINIESSAWMNQDEIATLDTTWSAKLMSSRDTARFVMATGVVIQSSLESSS